MIVGFRVVWWNFGSSQQFEPDRIEEQTACKTMFLFVQNVPKAASHLAEPI